MQKFRAQNRYLLIFLNLRGKSIRILLLSRAPEGPQLKLKLTQKGFNTIYMSDLKQKIDCDVIILHHYPLIIKGDDLAWVQNHINFNIHNTYLPYGRGIYGIMWAAALGYPQGFTLHDLDTKIDNGAILYREKIIFPSNKTLKYAWYCIEKKAISFCLDNISNINSIYNKRAKEKILKGFYKSRIDSMDLFNKLPKGWNTDISTVRTIGKDFKV